MKRRAFLRGLGAAGGLAFAPGLGAAAPAARGRAVDRLRDAQIQIGARIRMIEKGPVQDDVEVDARRRSFCTAGRPRRHADADGDAGRRETRRGRPAVDLQGRHRVGRCSTTSPSASMPGRATTTWCCRASATRAIASSRGAPPIPRCSPSRPTSVPMFLRSSRGFSRLSAGPGNSGSSPTRPAWRRPRSAFMCRRSSSASSCSSDRRRRAAAVRSPMRESDDRTRATVTVSGTGIGIGSPAPNKAPLFFEGSAKIRPFAPDAGPGGARAVRSRRASTSSTAPTFPRCSNGCLRCARS